MVDLFPTFARLARADGDDGEDAGADSDARLPLDGLDAWEAIAEGAESPREEVVYSLDVIRMGDWKLIDKNVRYYTWESKYLKLYNIREDPYESRNRAVGAPDKVTQLLRRLAYHRQFARDPEPIEEIPDFPPVVYGSDEQAAFGTEIEKALSELDKGNPGPTLVRAEVSGNDVRLVYDQALDADSVPPADAFRVVVNPEYRSAEVTAVEMSGSEVLLTLTQSLRIGETVGLTYEVPATGAIRDADGIAAVGVTWVETVPVAPGSLLGEVSITAVSSPVTEGTAAVFDVTLSATASEPLTVALTVTETGATLFGMPPASVSFAAEATSATLTVATEDDAVVEAASTVAVTLTAGDGYALGDPLAAEIEVADDDAAEFAARFEPAEVAEGGGATLTLEIANGVTFAAERSLALSYAGTASAADHDGPQTLVLPAGASSAAATVTAADDVEAEDAETLTASAALDGASVAAATLTIAASDAPPAADAALTALTLSGIALAFETDMLDYAVEAPAETSTTTVTATPSDADATVEIDAAAGTERTLPLAVGATTIAVTVTAADGTTTRSYSVVVTRPRPTLDFEGLSAAGNGMPRGIWSDGETLWVVDQWDRQLYAYSMATGQRVPERDRSTQAQGSPQGIWSDGETTWVLDSSGREARAYRQSDWRRRGSRDIALAAGNDLATGGWGDGATLWVAQASDGRAYAYSLAYGTRDAAKDLDLGVEAGVFTTALWSGDGRRFLAGRGGRAELRGHSASGREPSMDLALAADNKFPAGMWSDGATLWVSDSRSDTVHAYGLSAKTPNATLTVLRVEEVHVGRFAPGRTSYAATVPHGTTMATVTAWPAQGASVAYDVADADPNAAGHQVALEVGANRIGVTATAADGTSRTYAVTVTRLGTGETRALTASFEEVPENHDGEPFGFELRFSESPLLGYLDLRDEALSITGGTVTRVRRLTAGSNAAWAVTVAPDGGGGVELSLAAELACGEAGAVCAADGRRLSNGPAATVSGPAPRVPEIAVAADAPAVVEGAPASFTLTRTGAAAEPLAVAVSVVESASMLDGTTPTQVEFAATSATAALTLPTADDRVVEDDSTVTATLSPGTGYTVSSNAGSAQVSVADNDAAVFAVTLSPAEVAEGASATLTVSLGGGVTFAAAREIGLALSGTASAADYTLSAGGVELSAPYALTLAAGADSTAATLAVTADALAEPEETVTVAVSHAGAEVGAATATIPANAAPEDDAPSMYTVSSPDGRVTATVTASDGALGYAVSRNGKVLIAASAVSIRDEAAHVVTGSTTASHDESWAPTWGQYSSIRDHHNRLTLSLDVDGTSFELVFQVYDDGLGFRFRADEQDALTGQTLYYDVRYRMDGSHLAHWPAGESSPLGPHAMDSLPSDPSAPVVVDAGKAGYFALLESDLFPAAAFDRTIRFARVAREPTLRSRTASVPVPAGKFVSPWRVVLVGDDPGDLLESTVPVNLASPLELADASWVTPGKGLFNWRTLGYRTDDGFTYRIDTATMKRLIDFAAEQGLDYVNIDDGWWRLIDAGSIRQQRDGFSVENVIAHADRKGVPIFVYIDRQPPERVVATTDDQLFQLFDDLGAAGVKYGFHHDDVPFTRAALRSTAEKGLVINFHDNPSALTGVRRTMPNAITRQTGWSQQDGRRAFAPTDFLEQAMVNALLGPFDMVNGIYDIGGMPDRIKGSSNPIHSTVAGENARVLIVFSGLVVLPDVPEEYAKKADLFEFLREMPATWDDTRILNSSLPNYITTARRSGDAWFVCSATNESARTLGIDLEFLDAGVVYDVTYYEDDHDAAEPTHYIDNPETYRVRSGTVDASDTVDAAMVAGGGHCMWIRPPVVGDEPALADADPASDDATLSALTLSGIDIGPFAAATTDYAAAVAHGTARTTVTATPSDAGATVTISDGNGSTAGTSRTVDMAVGANAITVTVAAADGIAARTYTVTVTRAAAPPTVTVSDASAPEGETLTFTVTLDRASAGFAVRYATADGTATAGDDYTSASGTLDFGADETAQTVPVEALDDILDEGAQTFDLVVTDAGGTELARGEGTIEDLKTVGVSVSDARAEEGESLNFEVTLGGTQDIDVTVDYTTADGTATAGDDYASASGTLTFEAGERTKTVAVAALDDDAEEEAETFALRLSNASRGARLDDAEGEGTITASDGVTAWFESVPAEHDGSATFMLQLVLSEDMRGLSFKVVRDDMLTIGNGTRERTPRTVAGHNDRWDVYVTPASTADVTVTVNDGVPLPDGRTLQGGAQATVSGPAPASAVLDGGVLTLTWPSGRDAFGKPYPSDYAVAVDGVPRAVAAATLAGPARDAAAGGTGRSGRGGDGGLPRLGDASPRRRDRHAALGAVVRPACRQCHWNDGCAANANGGLCTATPGRSVRRGRGRRRDARRVRLRPGRSCAAGRTDGPAAPGRVG